MNFDESFDRLINHEGGLSKDPKDPGNWTKGVVGKGILKGTKFGIAAASYPSLDIENLTLEDAKAIYLKDFWKQSKADMLPGVVGYDVFDMAVNSGPQRAIMTLQKALGLTPDGKYGHLTSLGVLSLKPEEIKLRFNAERLLFLASLDIWPSQGRGWTRRVANIMLTK